MRHGVISRDTTDNLRIELFWTELTSTDCAKCSRFFDCLLTRVSLLSSKTHNGDYTPKNLQNSNYIFPRKFVSKTNSLCNISHNNIKNISLNKIVLTILKHLLVSEATIRCNLQPQCFNRITAVSTYGHIAVSLHLETRDGYHARSSNTVILMNASDEDE